MQKKKCADCGKNIYQTSIRCRECYFKSKKRIYLCKDCANPISYHSAFLGKGMCRKCASLYTSKLAKEKYKNEQHHSKGRKQPDWLKGKNHHWYKDGRSLKKYYCADCGKDVWRGSTRCKSCANKMQNNPNWLGGHSAHPYTSFFSQDLKDSIQNKDGYMCKICGLDMVRSLWEYGIGLHIHHINYNKLDNRETNLITLCCSCHAKTNYNRDYWYAYFTYIIDNCYSCAKHDYCYDICELKNTV